MDAINNRELIDFNREPADKAAFAAWCVQRDVLTFLEREALDEQVVVYAALPHLFLHAILIPDFEVNSESVDGLLGWNFDAMSQWSFVISSGDRQDRGAVGQHVNPPHSVGRKDCVSTSL